MDDVSVRSGCATVPSISALSDLTVWPIPSRVVPVICVPHVPLCRPFQRFQICQCGRSQVASCRPFRLSPCGRCQRQSDQLVPLFLQCQRFQICQCDHPNALCQYCVCRMCQCAACAATVCAACPTHIVLLSANSQSYALCTMSMFCQCHM